MKEDCIFCKIANKELESNIIYEDDKMICFKNINPCADIHLLVIPKKHIKSVNEIEDTEEDKKLVGEIFVKVGEIAKEQGFLEQGYKVLTNVGGDLQTVLHLHFHILSGKIYDYKL